MKQITRQTVLSLLPGRPAQAHKGCFGRVLVVAGSSTMCGAGFLTALGALRAGAGLVAWALPQSLQPTFAAALPEVITLPLSQKSDGTIAAQAQSELEKFCATFHPTVLAVGPGMSTSELFYFLLEKNNCPKVLDADALNFLAAHPAVKMPTGTPCIFTPHPGEMARLLHTEVASDTPAREAQARAWARQTGGVCVLKGAHTLVATPDEIWQNTTGSVALAKGGSGDVLTGVIAGMWAQLGATQKNALAAALCGVYLHGLAGEIAAEKYSCYSVLARETAQEISTALKQILQTGRNG